MRGFRSKMMVFQGKVIVFGGEVVIFEGKMKDHPLKKKAEMSGFLWRW